MIPDIEMRPGEIWRFRFHVRHRIFGGWVNERWLRRRVDKTIGRMRKLLLLCISPLEEGGYFYVTVKVLENPLKTSVVIKALLTALAVGGFLVISFMYAELVQEVAPKVAPAVARGMEVGVMVIAVALAMLILSYRKRK